MRFAVLVTGNSSPYTMENYGTYADLFENFLKNEGDEWHVFDSMAGKYPERLDDYDAIVITGSAADAHARDSWILDLENQIRRIHEQGTPLLGFCFGHQAIANALGGKTGRNPAGWEIGLHQLAVNNTFRQQSWAWDTNNIDVLEVHQDHVIEAPPGALILAETPSTPVQIFAMDNRVLCVQGHPEFENDIVADLVKTRMEAGRINQELGTAALESMEGKQQDRPSFRRMIDNFLGRK